LQNARSLLLLVSCPCLAHLACCLSHVVCCQLQSDTAPAYTQRIAAALAIERLSGRRDPLQTKVCVRACVRVSVRVGSKRDAVFVGSCACIGNICDRAIE
jgi:hypothetical protein